MEVPSLSEKFKLFICGAILLKNQCDATQTTWKSFELSIVVID